jgi:RNA polymerase sigma-70 factor (ECF subfamily)
MREASDDALLRRARRGNENAFLALFARHRQVVFRVACRLTDSTAAAEDITQDCFLSLLKSPQNFDPEKGALRTYLYAIVRNLARRQYWLSHSEVDLDEDLLNAQIDRGPEPAQVVLDREASAVVQKAVATLPLLQREALVLFHYEELSLEETAAVLGIEAGAVKSRLHRARERLKKLLAPYFEGSMVDESVR